MDATLAQLLTDYYAALAERDSLKVERDRLSADNTRLRAELDQAKAAQATEAKPE